MPMLGDILSAARGASGAFPGWLEAFQPELAREVAAAAGREGMAPMGFVRVAVSDFSRFVSEEQWATVISKIRDSEDPGTDYLVMIVRWRLAAADQSAAP